MDVRAELDRLADFVGRDRYARACEWAFKTAAEPYAGEWPDGLSDVPHDLTDPVWDDSPLARRDRLRLAFALYREMPTYAHLMYVNHEIENYAGRDRTWFWDEVRSLLGDPDDGLAAPVAYWLWVDWFETGDEEAWREVTSFAMPWERRMARVLESSGPVAWKLKAGLYARFAEEGERWHPHVFVGLCGSAFDLFGEIEVERAREILGLLAVPPHTPGLAELRKELGGGPARRLLRRGRR